MIDTLKTLLDDENRALRRKIGATYALLIPFNIAAWLWAIIAFHNHPLLIGTSLLAYSLGLRHAVDADHIAAIDNVTRKLMQTGRRPVTLGLMFSLGHSTIVILATIAIAIAAAALQDHFASLRETGAIIGTLVSAFFLFAIALMNILVLIPTIRAFRRARRGEPVADEDANLLLAGGGLMARVFRTLFGLITRSWHMYFLGLLFGLGFDTATEVGLLGIAAASATQGLSTWTILVFPALFTAGMTLVDTTDGILMIGAYGWAFAKPLRKLYYNITVTTVSIVVALLIGAIETLALCADKLHLAGWFWEGIGSLSDHFGLLGYVIIGVFAACWLVSVAIYRWRRFEDAPVAQGKET